MIEEIRINILKTLHSKMINFYEALKSKLSNYFGKKGVLTDIFGRVLCIQIQMYPQTSLEPKYGEFNSKNIVSAH